MARKFGPRQLKREKAPDFWPIHRKEATWATMTRPGPQARERSIPLVVVIRDSLGYARTAKEAKETIHSSKVSVDGVVRRDHRFPAGLMDVVKIQGIGNAFRVLPKPARGLSLSPITLEEESFKLCKITGKTTISGRRMQVNLHDGRNIIVQGREGAIKNDEPYSTGGVLQLSLPSQKILRYVPFKVGAIGLVTDGRNEGLFGKVASFSEGTFHREQIVKLETEKETFETPSKYVIPVGVEAPLVALNR
jgi:small subunit ribosomal protein S4e